MTKSRGILLFARNNADIDYNKMAYYCAVQAKKHLDLPVSIVTDSKDYLLTNIPACVDVFDHIIDAHSAITDDLKLDLKLIDQDIKSRLLYDGSLSSKKIDFKNNLRTLSYELSPYDQTLIIDTDYIIQNNSLIKCFDSKQDLMMYKTNHDLSGYRQIEDFKWIQDKGIEFFWATVVYFEKCNSTKIFFNLCRHIQDNWNYYRPLYGITRSGLLRNDFIFSIAVHILRGFTNSHWPCEPPGKMYYALDKDILQKVTHNTATFLIEKQNHLGEYTLGQTTDINVHVMNKQSLLRAMESADV